MKFPRLKNALMCRTLVYVIVIGGFIAPIIIAANFSFLPDALKVLVGVVCVIGLLVYIFKNIVVLMTMDLELATLHCYNTARKHFVLPRSFSVEKAEKRISRFGKPRDASAVFPRPSLLQYKSSAPITVYSSGIEKLIATYHIEFLDKNEYRAIVHSAIVNAKALKGQKKHRFLDNVQKGAPLNQVTVIVIFAQRIDENFRAALFDTVCKHGGDGFDVAVLPCVVDLEMQDCTFDSIRIPYAGFQYPVKNRGIRIIRKYLFHNRFPFANSPDTVAPPMKDLDTDQSLWDFWRATKEDLMLEEKRRQKRFENMAHKEVIMEDDYLYVKWNARGIWLSVELDEEQRTAEIDAIDLWDYPKTDKIAKATIKDLKHLLDAYFAQLGYATKYITYDE